MTSWSRCPRHRTTSSRGGCSCRCSMRRRRRRNSRPDACRRWPPSTPRSGPPARRRRPALPRGRSRKRARRNPKRTRPDTGTAERRHDRKARLERAIRWMATWAAARRMRVSRARLLKFTHEVARNPAMIETERLCKRYGAIDAVADLDLRVAPGQVLALLGPNGAGKTTTMRMIAGFLLPSSGSARVCGHDVVREPMAARRALGYLPEGAPSYDELSVAEFLAFAARVRGLGGVAGSRRMDEMIERLQLQPVLAQTIETLSKGYRRRVCLAQALLHDPPALILDEPTDGLDPNQQREVHALIRGMARDRAIIVSTHALDEVRAVCNRVAILAGGRLRAQGSPAELERQSRYHHAVSFRAPASALAREMLARMPEVDAVEVDPVDARVTVFPREGRDIFGAVVRLLEEQHVRIDELQLERGRLEDVFRRVTEEAADLPRAA